MMTSAVMSKPSLLKATPPTRSARRGRSSAPFLVRADATALGGMVPDQNKRNLMNYALLGAAALPIGSMVGAYGSFLVPPSAGGGSGGSRAKDALGNDIKATAWLADHPPKDYSLVQGLQAEPTYLIVTEDGNIQNYGVNSICTHLGCVVPWVAAENKFKCPCHGSQYDKEGKVIRGPAPLSLALAHASVDADDKVSLTPWTETDFRTGEEPWWK